MPLIIPPRSTLAATLLGAVHLGSAGLYGQPPSPPELLPAAPLTLDEAMTAALTVSPSLAAARLGRAEAQARRDIARLRPNPRGGRVLVVRDTLKPAS